MSTMPNSQMIWKDRATEYARQMNAFLAEGESQDWENPGDPPTVDEDRTLAEAALAAVRQANQAGTHADLREQWPPVQELLLPLLDENGQDIPALFSLDDGGFVARIGPSYQTGRVVQVHGDTASTVDGIQHVGRSPNRRYFALSSEQGVRVTDGWLGEEVCFCSWPTGLEGVPHGAKVEPLAAPPVPEVLIPFPDGKRVLLGCEEGVFVLAPTEIVRLLPRPDHIREQCAGSPEEAISLNDSMTHAALSPDGLWIAAGSQCYGHYIFDRDLQPTAEIGPLSEYPHYACFSSDSQTVILNSCHFYHGATLAVNAADWPGLDTPRYEPTPKTRLVEGMSRVYTAVHRKDEFIIGNANGDLRAFSDDGTLRWYHRVGSTLTALDLSPDGRHLYAASCAGWVVRIALDTHTPASHEIGSGHHSEERRWLFWKGEPDALVW